MICLYFHFWMITLVNVSGFIQCTNLGVCIGIVETWFGIADGQISSIFDRVICPQHVRFFSFLDNNFSKYQYKTWYVH